MCEVRQSVIKAQCFGDVRKSWFEEKYWRRNNDASLWFKCSRDDPSNRQEEKNGNAPSAKSS